MSLQLLQQHFDFPNLHLQQLKSYCRLIFISPKDNIKALTFWGAVSFVFSYERSLRQIREEIRSFLSILYSDFFKIKQTIFCNNFQCGNFSGQGFDSPHLHTPLPAGSFVQQAIYQSIIVSTLIFGLECGVCPPKPAGEGEPTLCLPIVSYGWQANFASLRTRLSLRFILCSLPQQTEKEGLSSVASAKEEVRSRRTKEDITQKKYTSA